MKAPELRAFQMTFKTWATLKHGILNPEFRNLIIDIENDNRNNPPPQCPINKYGKNCCQFNKLTPVFLCVCPLIDDKLRQLTFSKQLWNH